MTVRVGDDVWAALANPNDEGYSLSVVLHSSLPLAEAINAAETAWNAIWYDPSSLLPYDSAIAATAEGPAVWFDDHEDARHALGRWADELVSAGVDDGDLRVFQQRDPQVLGQWAPSMIEARFAVPASFVDSRHRGRCELNEDVQSAWVAEAVDWCFNAGLGDKRGYIDMRMVGSGVTRANAADVLKLAAEISGKSATGQQARLVVESTSSYFRAAIFQPSLGYISLAAGTADAAEFDIERSLAAVRDAMTNIAPYTVRALAKLTRFWTPMCAGTLERWDPPFSRWDRAAEDTALPDAFGLALVPSSDIARVAPLGPSWHMADLGSHTLLEHVDHVAWFGDLKPDAPTLDEARVALGRIIRPPAAREQTT